MEYSKITNEYLSGEKFNNEASVALNNNNILLYRDDYLLHVSKGKKIIHMGFVDHIPLIDEKIDNDRWLHKKLIDVSDICFGVDINKKGVRHIQNKYKYENLYAIDIVNDPIPNEIKNVKIDYLLIPDVIEHIGNPVAFLNAILKKFQGNVENIIITTPNAFRLNNFQNSLKSLECINTDHRFWFTPYTISKIAIDAGYKINSLDFCEHGKLSRRSFMRKMIITKFYTLKDTLILNLSLDK